MTHSTRNLSGNISGDPGKDIDEKIRQALATDEELAGFGAGNIPPSGDQNILQDLSEVFRGRQRWLNLLGAVIQLIYLCLCIWSAFRFFEAEALRDQILFATGFLASLGVTLAFKIWFWMVLNRNAVLREVKRLELQVARLTHD
ncbi:MAG: hypothetical protein K0U98_14660 [Deltaproteobacteria bacterium]|nr:hypothetical protein [Deltaproteobacteria bacterium]